jgi:hypothetical protein
MVTAALILLGCDMPSDVSVRSEIRAGEVERIRISALTEFVPVASSPDRVQLKTLLELIDPRDTRLKTAFAARFELYEFKPLSSNPRGPRLAIWPEQDLLDPVKNDEQWEDFLRGYEFYLPLEFVPQPGKKYLLEVSCLVGQRRLGDLFKLQYRP